MLFLADYNRINGEENADDGHAGPCSTTKLSPQKAGRASVSE